MIHQSANPTAQTFRDAGQEPATPLPNPGEGGPVYPGNTGAEPVVPLPNPGEGGSVYPGNNGAVAEPVIPLPNPGEGGSVYPGNNGAVAEPVIPLPNPGEGGPVYPGPSTPSQPSVPTIPATGGVITVPIVGGSSGSNNQFWNCNSGSCVSAILPGIIGAVFPSASKVRFLNAGYGYPAFRIFVGNRQFVNLLNYASATTYGQVNAGYQTVTVTGTDGYIYIQKTMPFQANAVTTIAVINTASGLDLMQITDSCCPPTNGFSSFRIGNLAYNTTPLDVIMSDGRVVWTDLRFKEVAAFKRIMPGIYQFFYADTNLTPMPAGLDIETLDSAWLGVYPPQETFGSLYLDITSNAIYTVYLLQSGTGRNNIQNLILMDR